MRIREGYYLEEHAGQTVVASKQEPMENVIVLNETAVFLWNLMMDKQPTKTELLKALLDRFDISTVLALGDLDTFLRSMKENGIITE